MANHQERLDAFQTLSFEDQKVKMLLILTDLKDADQVFLDLLDIVQNNSSIDSRFLVETYTDIMDFADTIRENDVHASFEKLTLLQQKIQNIREMELLDRAKENPDAILDQLV